MQYTVNGDGDHVYLIGNSVYWVDCAMRVGVAE